MQKVYYELFSQFHHPKLNHLNIIKGFTLNDERFKTGASMNYFNELQVSRLQFFESSTVFLLKSAAALITLRYSSNLSFG